MLVIAEYYLPARRAGGVVTAVANAISALDDAFEFDVLTRDRDLGEDSPYPGLVAGEWNERPEARVFYAPPRAWGPGILRCLLRETQYDVIYLNSYFSPLTFFLLTLRRLKLVPDTPVILCPRGEFAASALATKRPKKSVYRMVMRLGQHRGVQWQASSEHEFRDILGFLGRAAADVECAITGEVTSPASDAGSDARSAKRPGQLAASFVGRIHRIKNLHLALEWIAAAPGQIDFTIAGPEEDAVYRAECDAIVARIPAPHAVRWAGTLSRPEVSELLGRSELMILPSAGENFGHAIIEALAAGCPVLISDRTPWRHLQEAGVGYDVALDDRAAAGAALAHLVATDAQAHEAMRRRAIAFAARVATDAVERHRTLFTAAIARRNATRG